MTDTCNGGLCLTKLLAAGHQESSTAIDWFNDMIYIILYYIICLFPEKGTDIEEGAMLRDYRDGWFHVFSV